VSWLREFFRYVFEPFLWQGALTAVEISTLAMAGGVILGLGLALAQPRRPVVVITGDGEQLMGLGGLATISVKKPGNLTLVVLDNGQYGETGGQKSHTGLGVDLCRIAAATGFASAAELRTMAEIGSYRAELAKLTGGPRYVSVRIATGNLPRALPARDGVFLKNRFRARLGFPVA